MSKAEVQSWAVKDPSNVKLEPYTYTQGELGVDEVELKVEYTGLCHSDFSCFKNDWGRSVFPIVGGHEVVGKVVAMGSQAKGLKIGDRVGLGWNAISCEVCEECLSGQNQHCKESTATILDHHGGFAERVRAHWKWLSPVPESLNPAHVGPLLCGGVTVFAPIVKYVSPLDRVGIVGIGGLGHLAVKFARAWGCEVTAFTSSPSKTEEALALGAHRVLSSIDPKDINSHANYFDKIIVTINEDLDWIPFVASLRTNGKVIFVGVPKSNVSVHASLFLSGDTFIGGSSTGSRSMTDKMLEFCARHKIEPQCEIFKMSEINTALEKLAANKLRYRAVLKADFE